VAHHGIAETDECVTWSIGFRAPSHQELLDAYLDYLRDNIAITGRYADAKRAVVDEPAYVDHALRKHLSSGFASALAAALTPPALGQFLGEYLTTAKSHVEFIPPQPRLSLASYTRQAAKRGLGLDLRSKMLFDDEHIFLNGRALSFDTPLTEAEHSQLKVLANSRNLRADQLDSNMTRRLYPYWTSGEIEILE
jgi:50S ribosomal protein L16 3-hydroxylase